MFLLTDREREFLTAFVHEATTDPFKGPATEELHRRDIYYSDLPHLLAAYYRDNPGDQEGFGDKHLSTAPPSPWADRDAAVRRDRQVEVELERVSRHSVS